MIFHAINVVLLSAMTLYVVNAVYKMIDLVRAATVDTDFGV
ncbi:hypothetical protein QN386_09815 [Pseudomonas sp. CCI3.2]|nr:MULTISPECIES: hypothetical protein [unclassified Pseudomonas]MEB0077268.1 hypothetical protein [Pseudomonas sp. MH10out]MEB0091401.1 hypothetical protein [Pseudomonas sp. CCI4.2]MEB0101615.1 hypothetical protein [Pseudomonas sp. CCI3.2]MEB0129269.1 hypothetical protein [Pseudomonas sp. CCI2.4]MEB0157480.1 hypothetical protein [Pseudomonas sp. AH2 (2023)]